MKHKRLHIGCLLVGYAAAFASAIAISPKIYWPASEKLGINNPERMKKAASAVLGALPCKVQQQEMEGYLIKEEDRVTIEYELYGTTDRSSRIVCSRYRPPVDRVILEFKRKVNLYGDQQYTLHKATYSSNNLKPKETTFTEEIETDKLEALLEESLSVLAEKELEAKKRDKKWLAPEAPDLNKRAPPQTK